MGSFGDGNAILDSWALIEGRKLYPRFKQLADSLNCHLRTAWNNKEPVAGG